MTDTNRKADDFVAGLPDVADRTRAELIYARIGMVLMVAGFAVSVLAVILSQGSDNSLDQSTQLALGIAGLAAVGVGGVVFLRYSLGRLLRFWLLRMLHERHDR
ncbi:MAG TPA: hypothetical protein VFN21_03395 [Acidimicrobiales bacterium]|nr:hypothetical protein [Acidimicrobiales bacterium]